MTWNINQIIAVLNKADSLLVVGCNSDPIGSVFPEKFVVGVDISESCSGPNVTCDVLSLPFRDSSFGAVVASSVLHHLSSVERRLLALRELRRIVRPGGLIVVTVAAQIGFQQSDLFLPITSFLAIYRPAQRNRTSDEEVQERPTSNVDLQDAITSETSAFKEDRQIFVHSFTEQELRSFLKQENGISVLSIDLHDRIWVAVLKAEEIQH